MKNQKTERLILRPMEEKDYADFEELAMDKELSRMYGFPIEKDEAVLKKIFSNFLHNIKTYAIQLNDCDKMIGFIIVASASEFPKSQSPEFVHKKGATLAFAIHPLFQRNGYMTEALNHLIDELFSGQGYDYLYAGYYDFNEISANLQKKLGFINQGFHTFEKADFILKIIDNILFPDEFYRVKERQNE